MQSKSSTSEPVPPAIHVPRRGHGPRVAPPAPLTAAMADVLRRMARASRPSFDTLTADQARAAYEAGANVLEIKAAVLPRVEDFPIPADDGAALPARLYAPAARPASSEAALPVLLFFHGGGFTVGSIATHDILCRELARLAGCAVVSLDYRLAPEHKFPTAADDAWAALRWLAANATGLGLDASRIAVGGDSAGGTLAAGCALLARDAGLKLALQLLIYPGCVGHQDTESHRTYAEGYVIGELQITWFFEQYIRTQADRDDWRFAPLDGQGAPDADGAAPAWVGLAECDPLVDEGILYADRLRMVGVPVALDIYRGVTHEFIKMGRIIPEARQAHADMALALREAFGLPTPLPGEGA